MVRVGERGWKQCIEGQARGLTGPFTQSKRVETKDEIRQYFDRSTLVAEMRVADSLDRNDFRGLVYTFDVDSAILDAVWFIYVPTQDELERWWDEESESGTEVVATRIAEQEAEAQRVGRAAWEALYPP